MPVPDETSPKNFRVGSISLACTPKDNRAFAALFTASGEKGVATENSVSSFKICLPLVALPKKVLKAMAVCSALTPRSKIPFKITPALNTTPRAAKPLVATDTVLFIDASDLLAWPILLLNSAVFAEITTAIFAKTLFAIFLYDFRKLMFKLFRCYYLIFNFFIIPTKFYKVSFIVLCLAI